MRRWNRATFAFNCGRPSWGPDDNHPCPS